jgi:hypothetical protein
MEEIKQGYARVTSVLDIFNKTIECDGETVAKAFSGSRMAIDINVINNKGNIGTNVHTAIEAHLEGFCVDLNEREQLYFNSFLNWYTESGVTIVESEQRYYCDKYMITGKIDALVRFPNIDELILLDFKTSANESPKSWPLQATMYHYLMTLSGKKISDRLIFLKLDGKGGPAKVCEYKYTPELWKVCEAACICHMYANS